MNKCLNCGQETKNKSFCSISCQNKLQKAKQIDARLGLFLEFTIKCHNCGKEFVIQERKNLFPQKEKYYCSKTCANTRIHSDETKKKIGIKMKENLSINPRGNGLVEITCKKCNKKFNVPFHKRNRQFCCKKCVSDWMRGSTFSQNNGLLSVQSQKKSRRSKNEIYFSELCKNHFDKVLTNESIFNGWDADVIIEDMKIAVLWNGKWHYEKITKKHSVEQVQNRDKIKIKEIKLKGYIPYIIIDMGKYNAEFVRNEFDKFIKHIEKR